VVDVADVMGSFVVHHYRASSGVDIKAAANLDVQCTLLNLYDVVQEISVVPLMRFFVVLGFVSVVVDAEYVQTSQVVAIPRQRGAD